MKSLEGLDEEDLEWFKAMIGVRSRRRKVLVAEVNGRVVGFIIAYKYRELAYIDSLAVDPDYRDMGIGGKLIQAVEELLKREDVERVALSVKEGNLRALDFYLKRGYNVKGVILFLAADPSRLVEMPMNAFTLKLKKASSIRRLKSFKPTTWWSTLTEPVDRMVYKRYSTGEKALLVYRGTRVKGLAEFSMDDELFIDYVALSSYSSIDALWALLNGLRSIALQSDIHLITIPVDSTKEKIVEELYKAGFRAHKTEYLLEKDLGDGGR
ncbi:GNAT family N-acetyltransferase [Infirmifilum sp.]|uniref:GNAT family N-acetyltransferase n=1 Tax=Infirmifilum sp. TaxID=2856575 RepID=UPI00214E55EA|nr:GNAT family N-acetyltransferase [Infirmifilum uzonense]